jgi:hypothetical protein
MRLPKDEVAKLFREVFGMGIHGIEESSVIQGWLSDGRAKGQAEGKAWGLASARRLLRKFGTTVLGPPSPKAVEAIDRLDDLDRIEVLCDRLPSAASWEERLDEPGPPADAQP